MPVQHPALLVADEIAGLRLQHGSSWRRMRTLCSRIGPYGDIDVVELRPCIEIAHIQSVIRAANTRLGIILESESTVTTTMEHLAKYHDPSGW